MPSLEIPPLYLLDTNILVAYCRGHALGQWVEQMYALRRTPTIPLISVVTRGELQSFALYNRWGVARQSEVEALMRRFLSVSLEYPGVIEAYALLDTESRRSGMRMGKNDLWIAATAYATGARLLTTDHDFDYLNGPFIEMDWIDPASHL